MLRTAGVEGTTRAAPCPGLVDDAGTVRDSCLACGRCNDFIRDMMRAIAAADRNRPDSPARALA